MKQNIKEEKLKLFYELYPVIKDINYNNSNIISKKAIFKNLEVGEHISSAKDVCEGILFVLSGSINIKKISLDGDETNLYDIQGGEICHEALSCLLQYQPLNIVGTSIKKSEVCIIPIETVKKYILVNNEFLINMYKDIYEKFYNVIKKKEDKNNNSVEQRLIKFMKSKKSQTIDITHKELAMQVDSSREVVSRKLKEFEKKGFITIKRGKIIINNNMFT